MRVLHGALLGLMLGMGGDRAAFEEGVRLLRAGKAAEALAKLQEAERSWDEESFPDELLADLALAAWQAGQRGEAESYAERAAARRTDYGFLRDMIVGGARLAEGQKALSAQDPSALGAAVEQAKRAIAMFERALAERPASEEARRNLERALRLQEELERRQKEEDQKKEDQKKEDQKKEDQKKEDQKKEDQKKDDQKKDDQKKDDQKKDDQKKDPQKNEQKQDEQKQDEQKPQPKKQDEQKPQPKKQDEKDQQQSSQQPRPGEQKKAAKDKKRLLSPEELQRLLRALEDIEKRKLKLRADRRPRHTPGKKDW